MASTSKAHSNHCTDEGVPPAAVALEARVREAEAQSSELRRELQELRHEMVQLERRTILQFRDEIADLRDELMAQLLLVRQAGPQLAPSSQHSSNAAAETPDAACPSTSSTSVVQPAAAAASTRPSFKSGALRKASMEGDLETVQRLLLAGIDPNATGELLAGWTPLHYAAQLGHVEIIRELLDHGASPQPFDRFEETPLMQAGYWGRTDAAALLKGRCGGVSRVPPSVLASDGFADGTENWRCDGHVTILCSTPEYSRPYDDGASDNVMRALEGLCEMYTLHVKFGYDWGGSSTAEPADKDPNRRVPECCHSLACSCGVYYKSRVMVTGPVDWSDPKSVAGSQWFSKYRVKVMTFIQGEAQRYGARFIEMVALRGGPVTQLEHRTMPMIVYGAVEDLRRKGISISLVGHREDTKIKVCLRILEYDEFLQRFYAQLTLSPRGMCILAAAQITEDELLRRPKSVIAAGVPAEDVASTLCHHFLVVGDSERGSVPLLSPDGMLIAARQDKAAADLSELSPSAVLSLKLPTVDTLAVLRRYQYCLLSLSDNGLLRMAAAGKLQQELLAADDRELCDELGLSTEDLRAIQQAVNEQRLRDEAAAAAERAEIQAGRWSAHHPEITLASSDRALATASVGGDSSYRSAVCGEAPMVSGRHYAEFSVVNRTGDLWIGAVATPLTHSYPTVVR